MTFDFTVDLQQYTKCNKLGSGTFGDVYEIQEKSTSEKFAAKISKTEINFEEATDISENLIAEINILSSIVHPGIMNFIGFSKINFERERKPTIVTELLDARTLGEHIKMQQNGLSDDNFNSTYKHIALYGVASAMKYLHQNKILHKDLKPDNVLFNSLLHPKICDFGLSVRMGGTGEKDDKDDISTSLKSSDKKEPALSSEDRSEEPPEFEMPFPHLDEKSDTDQSFAQKEAGTPVYMAPEIINGEKNPFSDKSDVYSFSMIMYEMFSKKPPFNGLNILELRKAIKAKQRPEFDANFPGCYRALIEECWRESPSERPTFSEIADRLKSDDFLNRLSDESDSLDVAAFLDYCDFVDEFESKVEPAGRGRLDRLLESEKSRFSARSFNYFFPLKKFAQLDKSCQEVARRGQNDAERQVELGLWSLEGSHGFPKDEEVGVGFLKCALRNGRAEAGVYLGRFFISQGRVKDYEQAGACLAQCASVCEDKYGSSEGLENDAEYLYLKGKIAKKEGSFMEAKSCFKKSSDGCNSDAMSYLMYFLSK